MAAKSNGATSEKPSQFDNFLAAPIPPQAKAEISEKKKDMSKTDDPDFKQYSFLLKKNTHADATYRLAAINNRKAKGEKKVDMSDVVEMLLEEWLLR